MTLKTFLVYWGTYRSSTNRYPISPLKLSQQLRPSRQRLMTPNILVQLLDFARGHLRRRMQWMWRNHSPEWSSWPNKSPWSIQAAFVPVRMERDRTTESWSTDSVFPAVQSGPCSDAVYVAGRFITGVHYVVMQLSRLLYSCLPAPDSAFLHSQDVVNTFTHMASERFITHGPSVVFIHTSNSISSLSI